MSWSEEHKKAHLRDSWYHDTSICDCCDKTSFSGTRMRRNFLNELETQTPRIVYCQQTDERSRMPKKDEQGWNIFATYETTLLPKKISIIETYISLQNAENLVTLIYMSNYNLIKRGVQLHTHVYENNSKDSIQLIFENTNEEEVKIEYGELLAKFILCKEANVRLHRMLK